MEGQRVASKQPRLAEGASFDGCFRPFSVARQIESMDPTVSGSVGRFICIGGRGTAAQHCLGLFPVGLLGWLRVCQVPACFGAWVSVPTQPTTKGHVSHNQNPGR